MVKLKKFSLMLMACLLCLVFTGCGSNKVNDDDPNGWWVAATDENGETLGLLQIINIDVEKGVWNYYNKVGQKLSEDLDCSFENGIVNLSLDVTDEDFTCKGGQLIDEDGVVQFEKVKDPEFKDVDATFDGTWYMDGEKKNRLEIQDKKYKDIMLMYDGETENTEEGELKVQCNDIHFNNAYNAKDVLHAETAEMFGKDLYVKQDGNILIYNENIDNYHFYAKEDTDKALVAGYKNLMPVLNNSLDTDDRAYTLDFNEYCFYIRDNNDPDANNVYGTWEVKDDTCFVLIFEDGDREEVAFPDKKGKLTIEKVNKTFKIDDPFTYDN